MKYLLPALLCVLLVTNNAFAQYNLNQNKVWVFGDTAGVDFTLGFPVAISSAINTVEGCANVSDASGNLLFYTDGMSIWDRNNMVMPGGGSVVSFNTGSSSQGAVIVPVPGNLTQYYVFSLEQMGSSDASHLAYTLVDMTLHTGLGDVVSATRGVIIDSGLSEKMIVVPGNNCNFWVLVHGALGPVFEAYEVIDSGVRPVPVASKKMGTMPDYIQGVMKVSHDRKRIALASASGSGVELYDFDPDSGKVSNCAVLNHYFNSYGVEFSPDDSKLYSSTFSLYSPIYQYNLSLLPTVAAVVASEYVISTGVSYHGDIKAAANDKIYICSDLSYTLDCINSPNSPGGACGYSGSAISLGSSTSQIGLPSTFWRSNTAAITGTSICLGSPSVLFTSLPGGTWHIKDSTIATIDTTTGLMTGLALGIDTVIYSYGGCHTLATVTVNPTLGLSGPTRVCQGDTIGLAMLVVGGTWSSGNTGIATISTSGIVTGHAAGVVTISYQNTGCTATWKDTVINCAAMTLDASTMEANNTVTIYPNPASTLLHIVSGTRLTSVTITNIVGRTVYTTVPDGKQLQVDVSSWPAGFYFVKADDVTIGRFFRE